MTEKLRHILASRWFFYATILLFTVSSLWIAITSLYPMAFDEEFHFGLIKIYATSWLPYGIEHTKDMAQYGAATMDPSYLWHYLLSFPYRVMDWAGLNERSIVTVLRFINVSMVVSALFVYRRVLLRAKLSPALTHATIAFFTLIPILPMLAGQINYDNPLLLVIGLCFLVALTIRTQLKNYSKIPLRESIILLILFLVGASIKYAFVPIAIGIALWLLVEIVLLQKQLRFKAILLRLKKDAKSLSIAAVILLTIGVILSGFFAARYVVNYTSYGSFIPKCPVVFDETACFDYGPWARNYQYRQDIDPNFQPLPLVGYVAGYWLPDMAYRLTFAVAGPTNDYQTKPPLPGVIWGFIGITIAGFIALLFSLKFVFRRPFMRLTLFVSALYIGLLIIKLYNGYSKTGQPVAINGRYLLPLLPFIGAGLLLALQHIFTRYKLERWISNIAFIGLVLLIIVGAGISTYIIQSEPSWYY